LPEWKNFLQFAGIDMYAFEVVQIFPYGIYQLKSGTAVEITLQMNVQIIARSM